MTQKQLPKHVAIIMDGNGRWANKHSLPIIEGHRAGAQTVEKVILASKDLGLSHLTLYAFSTENFKRSPIWVSEIMREFAHYLENKIDFFIQHKIRASFIGDRSLFSKKIDILMGQMEDKTKEFDTLHVIFAMGYGARNEIAHAVRRIAQDVKRDILHVDHIDEHLVHQYLMTASYPDPDLFIRPSGEMRISNFLLWQMAYTEMVFTPVLWPDMTESLFKELVLSFPERTRCYGRDRYAA